MVNAQRAHMFHGGSLLECTVNPGPPNSTQVYKWSHFNSSLAIPMRGRLPRSIDSLDKSDQNA